VDKGRGDQTEGIILAHLLRLGKVVLLPFGNSQRYDLVIDEGGGRFTRAQCKTAWRHPGRLVFNACSVHARTGKKTGYVDHADVFLVYSHDTDKVYYIPVRDVGTTEVTLRLEPSKNNQTKNVRYAKDYEI
jgi:PD-(D/E)XK endonuclease